MRQEALELAALVPAWEARVRARGLQRAPGQLEWLKRDLGPMPSPEEQPNALALWAGALLNPIPSLADGVANDYW